MVRWMWGGALWVALAGCGGGDDEPGGDGVRDGGEPAARSALDAGRIDGGGDAPQRDGGGVAPRPGRDAGGAGRMDAGGDGGGPMQPIGDAGLAACGRASELCANDPDVAIDCGSLTDAPADVLSCTEAADSCDAVVECALGGLPDPCTLQPDAAACTEPELCGDAVCDTAPLADCDEGGATPRCVCPMGYTGDGVGESGCSDVDECTSGAGSCGGDDVCINLPGSYTCRARVAPVVDVSAHGCAVLDDGRLKCWGTNEYGQLGLGDTDDRGDDPGEMGDALPAVDLGTGRTAVAVSVHTSHTCAILDDGGVKCWGRNLDGALGVGDLETRGDEPGEMGDALPRVPLGTGRKAVAIHAGWRHNCALLDDGGVKCWGSNGWGQLGQENNLARGDNRGELGDALPAIRLGTGRTVAMIGAGYDLSCALFVDGDVKCWGINTSGELGISTIDGMPVGGWGNQRGDMGDNLPIVDIGTNRTAKSLSVRYRHTCVVMDDDSLKCWGSGGWGKLGNGSNASFGKAEGTMGDALPTVDVGTGRTVRSVAAGVDHTCAVLDDGSVKCWGYNNHGRLGVGDREDRGDDPDEMGDFLPVVDLGSHAGVSALAMGWVSCALFADGGIKCWGSNGRGQIGAGDRNLGGCSSGCCDSLPYRRCAGDDPGDLGDALLFLDL